MKGAVRVEPLNKQAITTFFGQAPPVRKVEEKYEEKEEAGELTEADLVTVAAAHTAAEPGPLTEAARGHHLGVRRPGRCHALLREDGCRHPSRR